MGTAPQVLHRAAKPISSLEFFEALRATCKPRFPFARGVLHRHVALAVSGGVDSMALAFLCARIRRLSNASSIMISDNPIGSFRALVVDHGLRPESANEASAVMRALRAVGVASDYLPINWLRVLPDGTDPTTLSNIESVARRARYRLLGKACANYKIASMLVAHHQDDQYETVLMRLLQGHHSRGLRGMRPAASIPECDSIHGAYNSGWVDDQQSSSPFYSTGVSRKQIKFLKEDLKLCISQQLAEPDVQEEGFFPNWASDLDEYNYLAKDRVGVDGSIDVGTFPIEDGGIYIYRPLLEFSKDRLMATCEANGVVWFEDKTNNDRTLTMRNAVRHMYKNFELPEALQKPAILQLSRAANRRAEAQDAEAARLLQRTMIHDFQPHVGSMVVQFPEFRPFESRRCRRGSERYLRRLKHKRTVAALLIQRIIDLVTPDLQLPTVAHLQNVVLRLFPSLQDLRPSEPPFSSPASPAPPFSSPASPAPPKAFPIAGLHFMPIDGTPQSVTQQAPAHPRTWYVARLPYSRDQPFPEWRSPFWSELISDPDAALLRRRSSTWSAWLRWKLFDGRFWIRISHRLPYRCAVYPFTPEHAKPFRESLDPRMRNRFNNALKRYAPGKVRYTLPGVYVEEYLDLDKPEPRPFYPIPAEMVPHMTIDQVKAYRLHEGRHPAPLTPQTAGRMRLLALPTLDIQVPGLDKWLKYETRFKRADRDTLQRSGMLVERSFRPLGRRRAARQLSKPATAAAAAASGRRAVAFRKSRRWLERRVRRRERRARELDSEGGYFDPAIAAGGLGLGVAGNVNLFG